MTAFAQLVAPDGAVLDGRVRTFNAGGKHKVAWVSVGQTATIVPTGSAELIAVVVAVAELFLTRLVCLASSVFSL